MTSLRLKLAASVLALVVCSGLWPAGAAAQPANLTPDQKVYLFQHRLIPELTHQTNGRFFNALSKGDAQKLLELAAEIVSPEFSAGISITPYPEFDALLISFPPPVQPPQCYFIFIRRDKASNGLALFTYEKTPNLFKDGSKGVVGSWTAEDSHLNLGARTYEDPESFVREMRERAR